MNETGDASDPSGSDDNLPDRDRAFFGRRKGKALRKGQADLVATLLPRLAVDLTRPQPADLAALFPAPVQAVRLEIGFGGAEHLIHEALAHPDTGFIGAEAYVNGMAKALARIDAAGLRNVRLHFADALILIDALPAESLARIDLLYPDPWPKKRHWKRRFVQDDTVARLVRVLQPGGEWRFASDIPDYVAWTLERARRHPALAWTARLADDWRKPWDGWPGTRYEAKALREGRTPAYLIFRKTG